MVLHELLNILVCPACKGHLTPDDTSGALHCLPCNLAFPVKDGIPVMLVDAAKKIEPQAPGEGPLSPDTRPNHRKVKNQ